MEEKSEEQVISRLFDLENEGQAAQRAYAQLLDQDRQAGELVATDSEEGLGDSETGGAEVRDRYSASDEDPLIGGNDDLVGEETDQVS